MSAVSVLTLKEPIVPITSTIDHGAVPTVKIEHRYQDADPENPGWRTAKMFFNSKLTGIAKHPYMVEKDKETRKKLCTYAKSYMELKPENAHPDHHIAEKDAAPETTKQKSKKKKALKNPPKFTKAATVQEAFTMSVFI